MRYYVLNGSQYRVTSSGIVERWHSYSQAWKLSPAFADELALIEAGAKEITHNEFLAL